MPLTLPERFEAGTLSVPAIMGLKKGIEFVSERGASSIYDDQRRLGLRLTDMITGLRGAHVYMPEHVGGTVLFNIDGIPSRGLPLISIRAVYVCGQDCIALRLRIRRSERLMTAL